MRGGFYFDWTFILVLIGAAICVAAQGWMKSTYKKYSKVPSKSGLTGQQTAERILRAAGITDVAVGPIAGVLTDHYDPRTKRLSLSEGVYDGSSLAAISVAAHECGHAIQHSVNYAPLNIRSAIVPVVNIGSSMSWPIFILGLFLSIRPLVSVGIVLFSLAVLFQLVTLPVEFNASGRALTMLTDIGILSNEENKGAAAVLRAAALTYVAALTSSVLQLLRMIAIANGGRSRDK